MTNLSILFCSLFLIYGCFLQAQDNQKKPASDLPFFIDADIGMLVIPELYGPFFVHTSLGAGYRFNQHHAVGLEYRGAANEGSYSGDGAQALGAVYRFTWKGVFIKPSFGFSIKSRKDFTDSPLKFDASGNGHYLNLTLGGQLRSGFLFGISGAGFLERNFNRSRFILAPEFDDGGLFPFTNVRDAPPEAGIFVPDGTQRSSFYTITLTLGYTFPGRGRNRF